MYRLIVAVTLLVFSFNSQAQNKNGVIQGRVLTSDGHPVPAASVQLLETNWGSTSDENGNFRIAGIKPGTYTLRASAINIIAKERSVTVTSSQNVRVEFRMEITSTALSEVVVLNRRLNREDPIVAKIPLTNLENPQVYSSVGTDLMKQQNITSFDDALRNVPNLSRTWESTGRAGDGGAYFALRGFDAQSALTNGLPSLASGNVDPANIEEIQVLKGPSGTLFGGTTYSYGGLINTITKKPYFRTGGEFTYQFGSFGLNRFTADINTPLSATEKIALRVNAAYHSENSFQDAGFKKSLFIAPSLVYQVNNKLSFHLMTEFFEEERAVPPVFFHSDRFSPLDFKNIEELNLDPKLSFTSNDLTIRNPRFNFQGQMIYKLSDNWTSQTAFSRGTVRSNGIYTYIWDDVAGDNWFSQWFHNEMQHTNLTDIQQNFNGDFYLGSLRNRVVVGVDYYARNVIDNGSGWAWGRNVTPQGDVNYVDPFSGVEATPTYLTRSSIHNILSPLEPSASNITNTTFAAYASDVLNITPDLMVMASVRADYFNSKGEKWTDEDDYDQWAVSPKLGVVYQLLSDKLSVFGNYMNAFVNVAPQTVTDADGSNPRVKSFRPEQANQWEVGVKANLFMEKLFATLSYYDIRVSDRVTARADNPFDYTQGGKVGSKGFEVDVRAIPAAGMTVVAAFSKGKTEVISGALNDFYAEKGRVIGGQGPSTMANFWVNYVLPGGNIKGLGFGLGGNIAGKYLVIDNSATGQFYLPSYTLINAALSYNLSKARVALNVNNLLNKQYYIGYWSVNPQKRINFTASVAYTF